MTDRLTSIVAILFAVGCAPGAGSVDVADEGAGLLLELSSGDEVTGVGWAITHPDGFQREGSIDVTEPSAVISAYISGIPANDGYRIALSATSTSGAECSGAARFDIAAGQETAVDMTLHCRSREQDGELILTAGVNTCPTIDYLTVSPLSQGVGSAITLFAESSDLDGDALWYAWQAAPGEGVFEDAGAAATRFTCSAAGRYALTLTVSDRASAAHEPCTTSKTVSVECVPGGVFDALMQGSILLGRPTDTSVAISVVSDIHSLSPASLYEVYFEYGAGPGALDQQTEVYAPSSAQPITASIDGLAPDTRHHYRMRYRAVGAGGEWLATETRSFHTRRAPGRPFVFTVQADSHLFHTQEACYEPLYWETIQNIIADRSDFHFDLGDAFNNKVSNAPWVPGVVPGDMDTIYPNYLGQLRYLGRVGRTAPVFLVIGNHENEEGWNMDDVPILGDSLPFMNQNARKRYFLNPVPDDFYSGVSESRDEIEGDHRRDAIYAFTWGDALFVALDPFWYTMVIPFTPKAGELNDEAVIGDRWSWTLGLEQYLWLKETLESSPARYKFVFIHHLTGGGTGTAVGYGRGGAEVAHLFEWGGHEPDGTFGFGDRRPLADGWTAPIHQLLVDNRVTVVFHGHDHLFAKEALDGVVYQEVPRPCDADPNGAFSWTYEYDGAIVSGNALTSPGHLRVSVAPEAVSVDYVRSPSGQVAFSYTIPGE